MESRKKFEFNWQEFIYDNNSPHKKGWRQSHLFQALNKSKQLRRETLFQEIEGRVKKDISLTRDELVYFSQLTEDMNLLRQTGFWKINFSDTKYPEAIKINLRIIQAILQYPKDDKELQFLMSKEITSLLDERVQNKSKYGISLLNAPCARLPSANLTRANFLLSYLPQAVFSDAEINGVKFDHCFLDKANFSMASMHHAADLDGVSFESASARETNFNLAFIKIHAKHADFELANFRSSKCTIIASDAEDIIFDYCDFQRAHFKFEDTKLPSPRITFAKANFTDGFFYDTLTGCLDDILLIPNSAFENLKNFESQLDMFAISLKLNNHNQLFLCKALAKQIIHHLKSSKMNDEKLKFFNVAIEHIVFQPKDEILRYANSASQLVVSIFSKPPYHHCFKTPALKKLESARDEVIDNQKLSLLAKKSN